MAKIKKRIISTKLLYSLSILLSLFAFITILNSFKYYQPLPKLLASIGYMIIPFWFIWVIVYLIYFFVMWKKELNNNKMVSTLRNIYFITFAPLLLIFLHSFFFGIKSFLTQGLQGILVFLISLLISLLITTLFFYVPCVFIHISLKLKSSAKKKILYWISLIWTIFIALSPILLLLILL